MNHDRHIFCLYSDDIRQEVNNKTSLMGIYRGGMTVEGPMPQILPRLVISAYVNTPVDHPFGQFSVDVVWNDKMLQNVTPPIEAVQEMQAAATRAGNTKVLSMQMVFVLQPFQVDGSGILRVRLREGDEQALESNGLQITVMEDMPPEATH